MYRATSPSPIWPRRHAPAPQSATHAWVECHLPELGWVGFDATNDSLAGQGHVPLAVGRDYRDVAPTSGVFRGGGESRIEVEVHVRPSQPR